jgi:hypothetical protein
MVMRLLCSLCLVLASGSAYAQGNGNGSSGGTKALADQIAALEARVSKLEGNISMTDLAGTYAFFVLDVTMAASRPGPPPQQANIGASGVNGTLVLNANGTGTLTPAQCGDSLMRDDWTLQLNDCPGGLPPLPATWSYANGIVNLHVDNDDLTLNAAVGGRVLINVAGAVHIADESSDTIEIIATRLH